MKERHKVTGHEMEKTGWKPVLSCMWERPFFLLNVDVKSYSYSGEKIKIEQNILSANGTMISVHSYFNSAHIFASNVHNLFIKILFSLCTLPVCASRCIFCIVAHRLLTNRNACMDRSRIKSLKMIDSLFYPINMLPQFPSFYVPLSLSLFLHLSVCFSPLQKKKNQI